jgi:hypothetical protein
MPANHRWAAQRQPGIKGGISSQKSCIPVFRIQRPVSRFNVLRTSTLGSRASSATRPGSSIYSLHPAERSAVPELVAAAGKPTTVVLRGKGHFAFVGMFPQCHTSKPQSPSKNQFKHSHSRKNLHHSSNTWHMHEL